MFRIVRTRTLAALQAQAAGQFTWAQAAERRGAAAEPQAEDARTPRGFAKNSPGRPCLCPLPYYPGGPVPCEAAGKCMRPQGAASAPPVKQAFSLLPGLPARDDPELCGSADVEEMLRERGL